MEFELGIHSTTFHPGFTYVFFECGCSAAHEKDGSLLQLGACEDHDLFLEYAKFDKIVSEKIKWLKGWLAYVVKARA